MNDTALPYLQKAVVLRLRATATFMALCTGGILDAIPQTKRYPYAVFDEPFETPDRTFGQGGHSCLFTLSIYTQDGSATKQGSGTSGFEIGLAIAALVVGALDHMANPLVVEGHDVVDVDVVTISTEREDDGITRRVDVLMQALLEDAA